MVYAFVTYNSSLEFDSPESWFKRTEGYTGVLFSLAKNNTVINIKQINYKGDCLHKGVHYSYVIVLCLFRFMIMTNNVSIGKKEKRLFGEMKIISKLDYSFGRLIILKIIFC